MPCACARDAVAPRARLWRDRARSPAWARSIIGPKKGLYAAAAPVENTGVACEVCSELFDIPTHPLPNFLSLTLTPSNQIIHPARCAWGGGALRASWARPHTSHRYYGIFHDWDGTRTYSKEVRGGSAGRVHPARRAPRLLTRRARACTRTGAGRAQRADAVR